MGVYLRYDCDELSRISNKITINADEFKNAYASIEQQFQGLRAIWEGDDANAFMNQIPDINVDVDKLYEQFMSIKEKIDRAAADYKWALESNYGNINSI